MEDSSRNDVLSQVIFQDVLFTSFTNPMIILWNKNSLSKKFEMKTDHSNWIFSLERCNQYLISGSSDSMIKIWDLESLKKVQSIQTHSNQIRCLHTLDDHLFAAGSYDTTFSVCFFLFVIFNVCFINFPNRFGIVEVLRKWIKLNLIILFMDLDLMVDFYFQERKKEL